MNLQILIKGMEEQVKSPKLPKCFQNEIALGHLWSKRKGFLSEEEEAILIPQYWASDDYKKLKDLNPARLKKVLIKVLDYLQEYEEELPLIHVLSEEKWEVYNPEIYKHGSFGELIIGDSKCWVEGETYIYDEWNTNGLRNKFNIKNYPNEPSNVNMWLEAQEKLEIDGNCYFMNSITKYKQFQSVIEEMILFCNTAITNKKSIYWISY